MSFHLLSLSHVSQIGLACTVLLSAAFMVFSTLELSNQSFYLQRWNHCFFSRCDLSANSEIRPPTFFFFFFLSETSPPAPFSRAILKWMLNALAIDQHNKGKELFLTVFRSILIRIHHCNSSFWISLKGNLARSIWFVLSLFHLSGVLPWPANLPGEGSWYCSIQLLSGQGWGAGNEQLWF